MRIASSIAFLSSYRAQIIRHGGQRDILHDAVSLSPIVKFSFAVQDAFHVSISQPPVHGHFTYRYTFAVLAFGRRANDTCGTAKTDNWHSDIELLRAQLAVTAFSLYISCIRCRLAIT
jgi:hypothetical protein